MAGTRTYILAGTAICSIYLILGSILMSPVASFILFNLYKAPALMLFAFTWIAIYFMYLANVHLAGGFLSGLFIGAKLKRRKLTDIITVSLAATTVFIIFQLWSGGFVDGLPDIIRCIIFPLIGTAMGNYLGASTTLPQETSQA